MEDLEYLTFVQVSVQLVKLLLLQSNLQMKLMVASSSAKILPLSRNVVRLLDTVRRAGTNRGAEDSLSANGGRQEDCEVKLHGGL